MKIKKTFVRLQRLVDIAANDTVEEQQRWLNSVQRSNVEHGWCLAGESDFETADFACDEMDFANLEVFDFAGGVNEDERFFRRDIVVYKRKGTNEYYVLDAEDLWEF